MTAEDSLFPSFKVASHKIWRGPWSLEKSPYIRITPFFSKEKISLIVGRIDIEFPPINYLPSSEFSPSPGYKDTLFVEIVNGSLPTGGGT